MNTPPTDHRFHNSEPRIHTTARLNGCKLGRFTEIGERVILRDTIVGDFTYFERNSEAIYTDVGKFCSIASNVRLNALEHPMERVSMHKMTYRPNEYFKFMTLDSVFREKRAGKRVTIGNDVWIGYGAVIMPGISIGHGAVIGANAVVTKDVMPYEIVAGVPAKRIRKRFSDNIIQSLLYLSWWNWTLDDLYQALPDMQTLSVEQFIDKWK